MWMQLQAQADGVLTVQCWGEAAWILELLASPIQQDSVTVTCLFGWVLNLSLESRDVVFLWLR